MREVTVLIVGDYESQFVNIEFDAVEMLNQQIEKIIGFWNRLDKRGGLASGTSDTKRMALF